MTKLVNRAKMTTATTGTGTITLGSAVDGYQTFAAAGVADADVVRYVIEDGDAWEIGLGTYTASGTTLTRGSIESSNADAALNLTGNAVVFVSAAAADLQELVDFADNFVLPTADGSTGQVLTTNGAGTLSFTTISGYTDADVDTHLNTGTASSGEVLSWNGSDYDWIAAPAALTGQTDSASPFETSLGFEAGLNTTGGNNTFIGYQAGKANTSGTNNVAVGFRALDVNTTATINTAVGSGALGSLIGGAGANTAVGQASLASLTTGNYNTALGVESLLFATTAYNVVALGDSAGRQTADSYASTYVGSSAGRNSNGAFNTSVGFFALQGDGVALLTGQYNSGIGVETGRALTTGSHNFLGGYRAGDDLTTGSNNVAIGNGALDAATTGGRNIAIGQDAMGLGVATAASGDNIAIGYQAGYDITTGYSNTLLGAGSGQNITSAYQVTALGHSALSSLTSGQRNVAVGGLALSKITTANSNVAIGWGAGDDQFGVGLSSGDNNVLLGHYAQPTASSVSNEITIGNTSHTRFRIPGAGIDNTSDALSGTTPSVDVGARDTYTLTTSGNTTFTFTGAPSSGQVGTFSLIITAGGTHTLTWPASVDWAGGTAPDAPASGEKDVYTFMTVDGGTQWFGFLAGDAMS